MHANKQREQPINQKTKKQTKNKTKQTVMQRPAGGNAQ